MTDIRIAPNPKKKGARVLKTDIPPPPSGTSTPSSSKINSAPSQRPPNTPGTTTKLDTQQTLDMSAEQDVDRVGPATGIIMDLGSTTEGLGKYGLPIGSTVAGTPLGGASTPVIGGNNG